MSQPNAAARSWDTFLSSATPAQLEAAADAILGETETAVARSNATRDEDGLAQSQLGRLDRWAYSQRPAVAWRAGGFDWYAVQRLLADAADLAEAALAPQRRREPSRAERRAATAQVDKLRCRSIKATRATKAEAKALVAKAGQPEALCLLAGENYCVPTRSRGFSAISV